MFTQLANKYDDSPFAQVALPIVLFIFIAFALFPFYLWLTASAYSPTNKRVRSKLCVCSKCGQTGHQKNNRKCLQFGGSPGAGPSQPIPGQPTTFTGPYSDQGGSSGDKSDQPFVRSSAAKKKKTTAPISLNRILS